MDAIGFDVQTPIDAAGLIAHVEYALGLGRTEADDFWATRLSETMHIVASGPSARSAPLGDLGPTVALNGALRLFTELGLAPTYWVACDPQALVADFLTDPPESTIYLVASKCHPAVFEALKDRKVIVWHVADEATWPILQPRRPVQAWVSVTLTVFELLARLGYRSFEVWGWDACRTDGQAYASPQAMNPAANEIVEVGGKQFDTTHTWMLEAQTAVQVLSGFPFPFLIHGDGLIVTLLLACMPRKVMTDHRT